jgi:hypothetical protein
MALERYWDWYPPQQNALRFSWQEITLLYRKAILQTITESYNGLLPLTKTY